ncbi:type I secretion system permease/ATPase [Aetokthonos hydrillicola Thurmond2011]|jgi:ATP-binding cassette subfamily B protein|uniref:Type I secretion system permease/ATPase n=1 Tax=Aetokthonos hydrillicola Thurmond2011 TaxID=2712845 RepID=A0AAP5I4X8_9CYAN|nr:peptidase domain-containing ABC transporter [Aetokthonos hydrillicola]MBO3463803.1 type I secretion system permease/ATPase [Aetokthonos hydrillicola CCALA 1050]MBW4590256.1 type I secretion system permease/ATPase [Aetokthonos hydrillicola CCALA 1050]MDR9894826.1 type I secretion system permease/ATPase [Aetokthonos hydrillicola Thurmond2011]
MASRENSKADGKTASELKSLKDESPQMRVLASVPWNEPPLCWLSAEQKSQLQNHSEIQNFRLGEKIWSTQAGGYHFLIISGKVRLREEHLGKSLVSLDAGDWFGDLSKLPVECKAVAASKQVVVVRWSTAVWAECSNPQIEEFWLRTQNSAQTDPETEVTGKMQANALSSGFLSIPTSVESVYPFVYSLNTGAACLTMVAQHLDNPVQLEWASRQLRGQRPKNVVEAAEKLGLVLRHLQVGWGDLRQLSFPALLLWNQENSSSSWVVAYGVKGNNLIIANPLNPDQICESLPESVVEACWDGQLWQVELIQKRERFNLSWFLPAVWNYRRLLIEVLLASFTLQLLGLTTPLITQVVIDKVMVQESLPTLDVMAIALLFVSLFEAILGILRLFIFTHTARRLDLSLSAQLFRHLMRLPLAYFESRRVGDTVARVQELEQIRQFLTGTALTVILDSIFAVVYLGLMFYYNIPLTWVALAVLPLFAALTLFSTPILRNWLNETFNRSADSQSFLVETVTGIHSVKAHAAEPVARDRWEGLFARFIRTGFKASTTSNISSNIGDFFTNFSSLLILWFGARLVIDHKLTVGQLVAFQMLSGRVTGPLLRLVQLWQNLQQVLLSVDRIGDILNVAPEAEPGTGLVLPELKGQITFEQVFFRYQAHNELVLKGISFTVQPGQFIGIVGRSGSGKSTLSKLLQRLYQIESGRILIDGFDIKSADLASLRQQIGVVLQEDFLFNGSILENITLGNPDISAEQVVQAARYAVAHDFISELAHGYETNVGERGTALSGGQRQRIALARLFLSQAPILVLDEATSALDSETEQQVLHNLQKISANRTVFLIAHRFAPLKRADLILVLERGVIAEHGTHAELLQQKGLYWSLYQRQQLNV